jgi:hypothetical protein
MPQALVDSSSINDPGRNFRPDKKRALDISLENMEGIKRRKIEDN